MTTFFTIAPNLAATLFMLLGGAGMLFPKSIASFFWAASGSWGGGC